MKAAHDAPDRMGEIEETERRARLRALRALVHILGDGAAAGVETAIADAERDLSLLPAADKALDTLPSITTRAADDRQHAGYAAATPCSTWRWPSSPRANAKRAA